MFELESKKLLLELQEKWKSLEELESSMFSYKLSVSEKRILPGQHGIYVELNMQRPVLRRTPQVIPQLVTAFDANKFNFTKINSSEVLANLNHEGCDICIIINKSPLTKYHMLICPELKAGHCQKLTLLSLSFAVTFMRSLDVQNGAAFRLGYNSPGALASVNHLHLHILHIEKELYIDQAKLKLLTGNYIYRLSEEMSSEAICFLFHNTDREERVQKMLQELYAFVNWLCDNSHPHNLFFTLSRDGLALKVFVFVRANYCEIKDPTSFNIGFCELSGFISLGDRQAYENLTENMVFERLRHETGNVYTNVYQYFTKRKQESVLN